MTTRLMLVLAVFALAAAPAAFADGGQNPGAGPAGASGLALGAGSGAGSAHVSNGAARNRGARRASIATLRLAILKREIARLRRCARAASRSGSVSGSAPVATACTALETRLPQQLQKLDTALQSRIAKLQQTCGSGSSGTTAGPDRCVKADVRIQRLQKLDARVQALAARIQSLVSGAVAPATGDTTTTTATG